MILDKVKVYFHFFYEIFSVSGAVPFSRKTNLFLT